MEYTTEIIVEIPREEFIKKINNPNNHKHWQRGLVSFEHISGEPGKIGAKIKLNYRHGKRTRILTETITHSNFPNELHANYDTKGIHNMQKNFFETTTENYTKWICINEFVPTNLFMNLMTALMPKVFKKQTSQYLIDFKNFAEKGKSVNNA